MPQDDLWDRANQLRADCQKLRDDLIAARDAAPSGSSKAHLREMARQFEHAAAVMARVA